MTFPEIDMMSTEDLVRELRKRRDVEQRLSRLGEMASDHLVHAMQMHQVELELQNQQLRETQEHLEHSRDRFAELYDSAPVGYCTLDPRGLIREANVAAAQLLGIPRDRLLGRCLSSFTPDSQTLRSHLGRCRVLELQATSEIEFLIDGIPRVFQLVSALSIDALQRPSYRTAISDVSALKLSERRMRLLSEVGETLAQSLDHESTLTAMVRLTVPALADICVLDALNENSQIRRLAVAHAEADSGDGEPVAGVHSWEPAAHWSAPQARVLASGQPELLHDSTGGLSMMVLPLISRGRTLGVMTFADRDSRRRYGAADLAFGQDIARRAGMALDNALLYHQAKRAIRNQANVLATVSHDLRTPLGMILLRASLVLDKIPAEADRRGPSRESFESIRRSAQAMTRLIDDLLDVASIEGGVLAVQRRSHSAEKILSDALDMMSPLAVQKKIGLSCEQVSAALCVDCDRERVLQVLGNLISNAIKFTPTYGSVLVGAQVQAGSVVFSVKDTGPGVSPDNASQVFERFWQAPETAQLGRGIGLSIAKGIVEAHGGSIWVENRESGGSHFAFSLPLPLDGLTML